MHRTKTVLLILLAIVFVAAGALLPYGTATIQNRLMERGGETRELDTVQLLIQRELSPVQILNLLKGEYTSIKWDSSTSLTEEQAMDAAFVIATLMIADGPLPSTAVNVSFSSGFWLMYEWNATAEPFLMISNSENQASLLLWQCTWESPGDAVYTLWIDDTTGMMCGMTRTESSGSTSNAAADPEEQLVLWTEFLFNNYGLWTLDIEESYHDKSRNTITLTLSSTNTGNNQDTCTVRLTYEGTNFSFVI